MSLTFLNLLFSKQRWLIFVSWDVACYLQNTSGKVSNFFSSDYCWTSEAATQVWLSNYVKLTGKDPSRSLVWVNLLVLKWHFYWKGSSSQLLVFAFAKVLLQMWVCLKQARSLNWMLFIKKQPPEVFGKKGVLKNFANFTDLHLY